LWNGERDWKSSWYCCPKMTLVSGRIVSTTFSLLGCKKLLDFFTKENLMEQNNARA
jgi:hypothetical protein